MNNYTNEDLTILLNELLAYPTEQTWLEFKKDNTDPERIGKYASALSNCASAANQRYGYLIWGIDDKTHQIVGTSFDPDTAKKNNQNLKLWLHTQLRPEISFEFFKFPVNNVQVVIMEVEAAYRQPIARRLSARRDRQPRDPGCCHVSGGRFPLRAVLEHRGGEETAFSAPAAVRRGRLRDRRARRDDRLPDPRRRNDLLSRGPHSFSGGVFR